jgi:thiaminase/transcriptional activator TenA
VIWGFEGGAMERFSDEAWSATQGLRAAIDALPFIAELSDGTLSRPRFQTYITQDALYLGQFGRALAIAGAKAPDTAGLEAFLKWALGAVVVETELHRTYLGAFGVDPAAAQRAEPSPDCLAYTSWLLATAYHEPWEVTVAALLPCFWIYWDVGGTISRRNVAGNPYQAWIDTYAGDEFGEAVQAMIATTDAAAAGVTDAARGRMRGAFTRACQYEYLFWDGAYQQRGWPG